MPPPPPPLSPSNWWAAGHPPFSGPEPPSPLPFSPPLPLSPPLPADKGLRWLSTAGDAAVQARTPGEWARLRCWCVGTVPRAHAWEPLPVAQEHTYLGRRRRRRRRRATHSSRNHRQSRRQQHGVSCSCRAAAAHAHHCPPHWRCRCLRCRRHHWRRCCRHCPCWWGWSPAAGSEGSPGGRARSARAWGGCALLRMAAAGWRGGGGGGGGLTTQQAAWVQHRVGRTCASFRPSPGPSDVPLRW